jgi:uncharacterized protein YjbI with pentapeptide repeats
MDLSKAKLILQRLEAYGNRDFYILDIQEYHYTNTDRIKADFRAAVINSAPYSGANLSHVDRWNAYLIFETYNSIGD